MRKSLHRMLMVLVVFALVFGIMAAVQADPGNGNGKGSIGKNCKKCPPAPDGCEFFECDNHFCNYGCGTETLTLPK